MSCSLWSTRSTAMHAAYEFFGVDRPIPPIYRGLHDPKSGSRRSTPPSGRSVRAGQVWKATARHDRRDLRPRVRRSTECRSGSRARTEVADAARRGVGPTAEPPGRRGEPAGQQLHVEHVGAVEHLFGGEQVEQQRAQARLVEAISDEPVARAVAAAPAPVGKQHHTSRRLRKVQVSFENHRTERDLDVDIAVRSVAGRGLHCGIITALGGVPRLHKSALIPQTSKMLAAEEHERGRTVALVLDEAHLLGIDQLEELRLLTDADMDSHSRFACLRVGCSALRRRIELGTFAALDQRIALRYAMIEMSEPETKSYLIHHLRLAGARTRCSPTTRSR